jgi:hypothetical protein
MRMVLLGVLGTMGAAQASERFGRWDATTSATYPVIRAYACPNRFTQFFTQPWGAIRGQALAAANEWFTSGGVDVRIRLAGDLAATDPRCADGPQLPNSGEILYTAEANNGAGHCFLATTFWWKDSNSRITRSKVILHSGTACGGTYQPYAWATHADYPQAGQFDFWSVWAHELGHALGFHHSADPNSIISPSANTGDVQNRKLATDDLQGLRHGPYGYGPIQTQPLHYYSGNGGRNWYREGEPSTDFIIGAPAVCHSTRASSSFYRVAQTQAATQQLLTYRTTGTSLSSPTYLPYSSWLQPAVACDTTSPHEVMAFSTMDAQQSLKVLSTIDNWSNTMNTDLSYSTQNPPALAYAHFKGWYVLAFTERRTGRIRTMVSRSGGGSWGWFRELGDLRTFHPFGLTCQDAGAYCTLSWADGNVSGTPLQAAVLRFDANGYLYVESQTNLGYNSHGGGVASDPNRFQFVWRDRGTATVLASGGWPWPPTLVDTNFTSSVLHAAPNIARNPTWNEYTAWSSFAPRYDL